MPDSLATPLPASKDDVSGSAGRLAMYSSGGSRGRPLLLVHSVNAAASAYEIKPLFEHYTADRPVYALDLPGFGLSDRSDRPYVVRTMTDSILALLDEIGRIHKSPVDAIALSLSCEFLARAALERPRSFRSIGFISPTGFEGKARDQTGGTRGKEWLRRMLNFPLLGKAIFALLTTKPVIRKFLEKTWGSKNIDQGLLEYDLATSHQPGARFAPYYFVSGFLFSKDILRVYESLRHPIWMVHGTRGDFVDYHHKNRVEGRANWNISVLPTGAFPQFEQRAVLVSSYDSFLSGMSGCNVRSKRERGA